VGFFYLTGQMLDPPVRLHQLIKEQTHGLPGCFRQLIQLPTQPLDVLCAFRRYDTELRHMGSDRVADLCALANQKVPGAVEDEN
jgi:hypothetical protein